MASGFAASVSDDRVSWFDRGLQWCYGYDHLMAVTCFERAVATDPADPLPYWGIAYAIGPNYNKPWSSFDQAELAATMAKAHAMVGKAAERADRAGPVAGALVDALLQRYPRPTPPHDCAALDDAYAAAMRSVHARFGDDLDVIALRAEAAMVRTPGRLWDLSSGIAGKDTETLAVRAMLEGAFESLPGARQHLGMLHMYLHLMEQSPEPEAAVWAADALRDLQPEAGHARHMPSHIDVLCGDWAAAVRANERAIEADREHCRRFGPGTFQALYRCHDYHLMVHALMMQGASRRALAAARELEETVPLDVLRVASPPMADWLEGYRAVRLHVLVRFGLWRRLLAEPEPPEPALLAVTAVTRHYARGLAYAALGDVAAALAEREAFNAARARVPPGRHVGRTPCTAILEVAAAMLAGEIAYRRGRFDAAFDALREAVRLEDALPIDEPWGWMQPTRHALGALLLEQGRIEEALSVYRADLGLDASVPRARWHPNNVWALHGLQECSSRMGDGAAAAIAAQQLRLAAVRADVPITASCGCRRTTA